ncbi:hypothetical protein SSX86_015292 [Deinandra increscens subsp. villosa]|uniref:RRM domain-containing protein n=1 Tax=Deinandra increscens subsp. villosa TaxID=3103831 RepID=A0AAP0CZJ0_9ASTR
MTSGNRNAGTSGDTTLTKVFVGGLAWETPSDALNEHFEKYDNSKLYKIWGKAEVPEEMNGWQSEYNHQVSVIGISERKTRGYQRCGDRHRSLEFY